MDHYPPWRQDPLISCGVVAYETGSCEEAKVLACNLEQSGEEA
jgi:hypothetical protein